MKRTTMYVALDVHQATTVASVREESGSGSRTGRTEFDSNQEILSQLLTLLLSVSAWPSRPLRVAEVKVTLTTRRPEAGAGGGAAERLEASRRIPQRSPSK